MPSYEILKAQLKAWVQISPLKKTEINSGAGLPNNVIHKWTSDKNPRPLSDKHLLPLVEYLGKYGLVLWTTDADPKKVYFTDSPLGVHAMYLSLTGSYPVDQFLLDAYFADPKTESDEEE